MVQVSYSATNRLQSLLLCIFMFPVYVKGINCSHYYLSQPVRQITCNPYHTVNPSMRLECNAYSEEGFNFEISWFYSSIEGIPQQLSNDLGNIYNISVIKRNGTDSSKTSAAFIQSELIVSALQNNDIGSYWCQIGVLQEVNQTMTLYYLEPSQATLLLQEENYANFLPCPRSIGQHELLPRCANDPLLPDMMTTGPPPPDMMTTGPPPPDVVTTEGTGTMQNRETSNCTQAIPSSVIPSWSYGLMAALALFITTTLLLIIILLCKGFSRANAGSKEPKGNHSGSLGTVQKVSDQPPVPHMILQVNSEASAPASVDTDQTLHARSPPTDQDCDNVIYAEADMPYTQLSQDTMDGPSVYTSPTGTYTKLDLHSIDNPHLYSAASTSIPIQQLQ